MSYCQSTHKFAFPSLWSHVEASHNTTMSKKKKKGKKHTSCPLCFLKFINSVLPVLSTALDVMFIKMKRQKG